MRGETLACQHVGFKKEASDFMVSIRLLWHGFARSRYDVLCQVR